MNWYTKIAMPPNDIETQNPIKSHEILVETLPVLQKKIQVMVNRANKLGLKPIEMQVSKPYPKEKAAPNGRRYVQEFVTVTIIGEAPVLGGWQLLARLEHSPDPNNPGAWANIPSIVPGETLPPIYYTTPPTLCEAPWCGREITNRKDTFVVRNVETGETKQIGRNCISTFLGSANLNPQSLANYYASFKELDDYLSTLGNTPGLGGGTYTVPTDDLLAWTRAYAKRFGFKKGDTAEAARKEFFGDISFERTEPDTVSASADDIQFAQKARQFILSKEGEPGLNDFIMTLINMAKKSSLTFEDIGRAVWIIGVYEREKASQRAQQGSSPQGGQSQFLGQEGQKVLLKGRYEKTREWRGDYGTIYYHQFTESHGNKVTWRTSKWPEMLNDQNPPEVYLQGTIKKLDDFKGQQSTLIVGTLVPESGLKVWRKKVDVDLTTDQAGTPSSPAGSTAPEGSPQTPAPNDTGRKFTYEYD